MTGGGAPVDWLFATRWVHLFEEDTAAGAVYRPLESEIPLSRRPREQFELSPGGSARLFTGSPDDRLAERPATWREDASPSAPRTPGAAEIRIVDRSPDRLVVKIHD